MTDNSETALRRKAARRADAKLAFRWHLVIYLVVNAAMVAINLRTSPDQLWFYWPMAGWGIGLIAHWFAAHSRGDMREDMIEAEMERLRARQK